MLSLPGCSVVAAARHIVSADALRVRDAVRAAPLPIPLAAVAASMLSLIIYVAADGPRGI